MPTRPEKHVELTGPDLLDHGNGRSTTTPSAASRQASHDGDATVRLPLEPMDSQLKDIQPGSGVIIKLELAWGHVRRWYLKQFRPAYVRRMAETRLGSANRCPHEVLDPRDVKFYRNQDGFHWNAADDPFRWRERIPFARDGLAELLICSLVTFGGAAALLALVDFGSLPFAATCLVWLTVVALVVIGALIVWFFRDPNRDIPQQAGAVISPADGKVVGVDYIEHDEFIGGPAVMIGIFLSILNVHVNRSPMAARVIGLSYRPGKCLNAMRPESSRENERLTVRMEQNETPYRRMIVRQITGAIARRIVCWLKPGDELRAGERFGMIKLGSRAELLLPNTDDLLLHAKVGQIVRAGSTVLAEYAQESD